VPAGLMPVDLARCPELGKIVDLIARENPLQRKRIGAFLARQDEAYFGLAEDLSRTLNRTLLSAADDRTEAARSYNKMCRDFLYEQIRFRKRGAYRLSDAAVAADAVYGNLTVMRYYMIGLLLSYMFWPNHYELLRFFLGHLPPPGIQRYLEVGIGHGLFTTEVLRRYPGIDATLVDISATSIATAKDMLQAFEVDLGNVQIVEGDYLKVDLGTEGYDFVVMGEVLEHVNDARSFLRRTRDLLRPAGTVYLTTCANCPAIDHVYHFHSVSEIREHIEEAGLEIVRDVALPADDVPEDRWAEELTTINYAALLTRGARTNA
jgi:SAM-dependent methyltransferase